MVIRNTLPTLGVVQRVAKRPATGFGSNHTHCQDLCLPFRGRTCFVLGKKDGEVSLDGESAGCGRVQDVFGLRSSGYDPLYNPPCLAPDQTPHQVTGKSRTCRLRTNEANTTRRTRGRRAPVANPRLVRRFIGHVETRNPENVLDAW